jgi:hypothetical protein
MNRTLAVTLAIGIAAAAVSAQAADDSHAAHHPAGGASAPASKAMAGMGSPDMARMDAQMKAMGAMHDRMMAAKTPEERSALMTEHMNTMQDGMAMMIGMSPKGGMGGMKGDMATQHGMMEKRMEMMQDMMQMMIDRMPAAATK